MKRRRSLLLLLPLLLLLSTASARRPQRADSAANVVFAFTAPVYNVTLAENDNASPFAANLDATPSGVPLPDPEANVRFKIVKGDEQHHFKAHHRQVGDFVFLRIKQKEKFDMPLNRELKDRYEFLVKATCKRKDAGNLEATTIVRLTVIDRNDASPMFTKEDGQYEAEISDLTPPFTDVVQVSASDADEGLNGQIYYSLVNHSSEFTIDPVTGWVRTLKHLKSDVYNLKVKTEDRTSRLFYEDEDQIQPSFTATVQITVKSSQRKQPKLLVETKAIEGWGRGDSQLAAIIQLEDATDDTLVGLVEDDFRHWFTLNNTGNKWMLYTVPGKVIPPGTSVNISAGGELRSDMNKTATIKIHLLAKHNISFGQSRISFNVNESVPLGYVVGQVQAEALSVADSKNIRYYIESLDANGTLPFSIGENSGVIRISEWLDFETQKEYRFNVLAKLRGSGHQATVVVEIFVKDSNDHPPVWAAKWSRQGPVVIPSTSKIGSVILKVDALDQDAGENGRVGYKLSSDKPVPFTIGFETGEIVLSSVLPKSESEWRFSVWAVDWGHLPRTAFLNLVFYRNGTKMPTKPKPIIGLDPVNRKAPQFVNFLEVITVREDEAVGTVLGSVTASDDDVGYGGVLRYSTWDEQVAIDALTGEITVASDLSNVLPPGTEIISKEVEILVFDQGTPPKMISKKFSLKITDVNDNAPIFEKAWYRLNLPESTKVGTLILQIVATDQDAGENGKVGYRLAGSHDSYIEIEEANGKIKLQRSLDREMEDVLRYTIVAFDYGSPQRMSFVNLTIEVDDVNDNPPSCVQPVMKVRMPEDFPDGALIGCVAGQDADIGANARLTFTIDSSDELQKPPFSIDHRTGCVFLHSPHQPLDYQRRPLYNVTIEVSDNGEAALSTTCILLVELLDVDENLHAPKFDENAHEASVYENMPIGTEVFTVQATDDDHKDEQLVYSIVGGSGMGLFSIDSKGTIHTTSVLDREEKWKYWLTVEASDSATIPKKAYLHLYIRVLDKNDHRPAPTQPIYYATIKENSPQNVVVVKVEATDGDDIDGNIQQLQYKIERGDPQSFFSIDPTSGYITTSGSRRIDRETQREHELWIRVCDAGDKQLCSLVPVVITVEDVNDNAPSFGSTDYHFTVQAGKTGALCRVFAKDADAGKNAELYYNFTEADSKFTVDEYGTISTSEPLEAESLSVLRLQATDKGTPSKSFATRVVLTAVAPAKKGAAPLVFTGKGQPNRFPISDADNIYETIGRLDVVGKTGGNGEPLWWRIDKGNVEETFAVIVDKGQLVLARPIQNLPTNLTEMTLTVVVTDGVQEEKMEVVVEMSRSPTTRPKFSAQHYKTQISEKTAIGTQIYTMKATSEDVGSATKPIIYAIHSVEDISMEDKLRIEPSTGNVVVMESLDFEAGKELRAIVSARQGALSSYTTLTVAIVDDNDNPPKFVQKEYEVKIPLAARVGSLVTTVVASDADSGENGVVKYSIVNGNEMGFFGLDANTGEMRVVKPLSDEYVESIVTVRATDGGKYALTGTATVRIQTTVDEENSIRFTKSVYQRQVKESIRIGSTLLVVSTEPNGQARYSLQEPCPYFDVNPMSGAVTLAKWLTRERAKTVTCNVFAKTRDGLEDAAKIIIKTINTNQHAPIFKQQVYRASIRENSPAGSAVLLSDNSPLIVAATDKDSGPNSLIGYRILNPNEPYFIVDFVSGAIRSRRPIDYEKVNEWSFYVQASDMGQPVRTSPLPALVIITVIDENDIPPVFTQLVYEAVLLLPSAPGVRVTKTMAEDKDTVGKVRYFLMDKNANQLFSVDSSDGSVLVKASNSSLFKSNSYEFDVSATDGVHSASTTVKITTKNSSRSSGFRFARSEYYVSIKENTTFTQGQPLYSVTAIGALDGMPVTYSIVNERPEFMMHSGTGMIAMVGPAVDREKDPVIRLLIQARTHETKSQIAQTVLVVKVEDVNDSPPIFINTPYEVALSIEAAVGEKVVTMKAVDRDSGRNGMVQYFSSSLPNIFKLNKLDGKITVASSLVSVGTSEYRFEVDAVDQGVPALKSMTSVLIKVVEKARPVFSSQFYQASISESAAKGARVIGVKAVSNTGGHIVFSIEGGNEEEKFSIDWDTGVIQVNGQLDREVKSNYTLIVGAEDVTRNKMQTTCTVKIEVLGVNDNGPVFNQSIYRIRITESTPVGSLLTTVEAIDPDEEDTSVSYAASGPDSKVVKVDATSGAVSLAESLDFEKKSKYEITLVASDGAQLTGQAMLIIEVEDMNDVPPRFTNPFASADLADTALAGQFVAIMSVTDEDTTSSVAGGHRLLYSVIDGDETLLNVDRHTGEVTLGRPLDEEDIAEKRKQLNVSVSDGVFTAYGQLIVNIVVTGRRQPPPRFEQSQYVVGLRENNLLTNKSALLSVKARDGVAPLHYRLGGGKEAKAWPVKVDKNTGKIHARAILDYATQNIYQIPLVVEDSLGRRAFSTLTLNVLDENDSTPQFVVKKYTASINAAAREGDTVLMVSATDDDEGDQIEYSRFGDDRSTTIFSVHPRQGTITVIGKVDKMVGSTISFVVKATDLANPPHDSLTDVSINVLSAETPVPKFSNSHYMFTVQEDAIVGTVIGKLQQIEADVDEVRYSVSDGPANLPFSVERASGKLIVRQPLDRETKAEWRFAVRVEAAGGAHAMSTVTIRLADVDDNAPMFHGSYDRLSVPEDSPVGTSVAVFSATDKDRGPGSRISFSLVEPSTDSVRMDAESGWLLVSGPLDRETNPHYDLTARATDEGGLSTDIKFKLEVTDVNDEAPIFDEPAYSAQIDPSQATVGQIVAKVTVTDKDLPPFNTVHLFISRGNQDGVFKIDESGRITLDRLTFAENPLKNVYDLTILAFDGTHSTTAQLKVHITNSSRMADCSTDTVYVEVEENSQLGTVVLTGEDRKLKPSNYQLLASQPDVPFAVNPEDGTVTVSGVVDREKMDKYEFDILSTWKTPVSRVCSRHVTVIVRDLNDNSPIFSQLEYHVSVKENQAASDEQRVFLIRVNAEDADSGDRGRIVYSLKKDYGVFVIDSKSGAITIRKPLDRETQAEYRLDIVASDSDKEQPKTAIAVVLVSVADQNDNPPAFEKKEYVIQVMESESVGYTLVRFSAEGGDEGESVVFSLAENGTNNDWVKLDEKTGVLTLARPLDFENQKALTVTVVATDSGSPPLSSTAVVDIQVLDENDNVPVFSKNSYKAEVEENSKNGTKVVKIDATDKDSEHYGRVAFSLTGDVTPFQIDEHGWITVAGEIDFEKNQSYRLTVEARDGGEPAQTASVTVVVTVVDKNDNPPIFVNCNMTAVVQESAEIGHRITSVTLRDPDGPAFGAPFKLEVKGEGSRAFMFENNGSLVTAHKLDHSKKERYLLTLIATDQGGLSSECPLTLFVKKDSRHPPSIKPMRVYLNTLTGEFRGGIIGTITAKDQDPMDMLRYSLLEDTIRGPYPTPAVPKPEIRDRRHAFRVDSATGEIFAEHSITPGLHAFNVSVTDGKFEKVSYVEIEVFSMDKNTVDYSVAIRLKDISAADFFAKKVNEFKKIFAMALNVEPQNINLLSVQETSQKKHNERNRRAASTDVDVLFTVSRGGSRGLLKPDMIYQKLRQDFQMISDQSSMRYQLTTEMCNPGLCRRGECRETIQMDDQQMTVVSVEGTAFVAPRHLRIAECLCPEGFGGLLCDVEMNKCARSPCEGYQMCVSDDAAVEGFECICPPGTVGERCEQPSCSDGVCSEESELSVGGNGFFEMLIGKDVETRMELEFEVRTVSAEGVLLHAQGAVDYHTLEIVEGRVEYRWDAGAGRGIIRSTPRIADGKWHTITVSRRGRKANLIVDHAGAENSSPAGAEVLNLRSAGNRLVFGAKVEKDPETAVMKISEGIVACFRVIKVDNKPVAKTRQGLRLHAATNGCRAMAATPCSEAACQNGATCQVVGNTYRCECPERFKGRHCEEDTNPCMSNPCPLGIQCIPYTGDFLCQCPSGFTGKRCEARGYGIDSDIEGACSNEPCGPTGKCIPIPRQHVLNAGYICNCTTGLSVKRCGQDSEWRVSQLELIIVVSAIILILLCCVSIIMFCRHSNKKKYGKKSDVSLQPPHNSRNPLLMPIHGGGNGTVQQHYSNDPPPPPLPPRFRGANKLPVGKVLPLPTNERISSTRGDSRSPSLGSGKHWKNRSASEVAAHHYGSAADDLEKSGRSSQDQFEALRRFGFRVEDDNSSESSGPSRMRREKRSVGGRDALETLNKERYPLGDSIQCLPTNDNEPMNVWGNDRIGEAVRIERLRLEALSGRVQVGDTVLSPVVNDDDYMTMRPRRATDSAESQRRPLLENEEGRGEDGPEFSNPSSSRPIPPAHRNLYSENSRLYDDPAESESRRKAGEMTSSMLSSQICDIDASDTEDMPSDLAL